MAYLTLFCRKFPKIHGKNPNVRGGGQAGWAKIPTFTENLFWKLPLPGVTSPGWAGLSPWSSCHNLCLGKNVKSVFAGTFKNLSRIDFAVKGRPGRSILRSQGNHWRKIHSTQWGIWEEAQCLHVILQISHAHLMCVHSPLMEVENENSANYTAGNHHLNH